MAPPSRVRLHNQLNQSHHISHRHDSRISRPSHASPRRAPLSLLSRGPERYPPRALTAVAPGSACTVPVVVVCRYLCLCVCDSADWMSRSQTIYGSLHGSLPTARTARPDTAVSHLDWICSIYARPALASRVSTLALCAETWILVRRVTGTKCRLSRRHGTARCVMPGDVVIYSSQNGRTGAGYLTLQEAALRSLCSSTASALPTAISSHTSWALCTGRRIVNAVCPPSHSLPWLIAIQHTRSVTLAPPAPPASSCPSLFASGRPTSHGGEAAR